MAVEAKFEVRQGPELPFLSCNIFPPKKAWNEATTLVNNLLVSHPKALMNLEVPCPFFTKCHPSFILTWALSGCLCMIYCIVNQVKQYVVEQVLFQITSYVACYVEPELLLLIRTRRKSMNAVAIHTEETTFCLSYCATP